MTLRRVVAILAIVGLSATPVLAQSAPGNGTSTPAGPAANHGSQSMMKSGSMMKSHHSMKMSKKKMKPGMMMKKSSGAM